VLIVLLALHCFDFVHLLLIDASPPQIYGIDITIVVLWKIYVVERYLILQQVNCTSTAWT